jgi:hypothetical protein
LLCLSSSLHAEPTVENLVARLQESKDFRVRMQAALALGASEKRDAIRPLCQALDVDESQSVRSAAAAALGRLRLGGQECLERGFKREQSELVKASIEKALVRLGVTPGPAIKESTRYYISIGATSDQSGRRDGKLDQIVRDAMRRSATMIDGFAVAPDNESQADAEKLLTQHKRLRAYHLLPKIPKPEYAGGNLRVQIEVAMFTYPTKALLGSFSVKLTQQSVPSQDPAAEENLIKMVAERAMEKFSQNVEQLR